MLVPVQGHPQVQQVDTEVFTLRYFTECLRCTFCHDRCCQYGCDVNWDERSRILAHAEELEAFLGRPRDTFFKPEVYEDPEYPSGRYVRSAVVKGACGFLNPHGRGCGLHAFAARKGLDYHDIKPTVCWLFPVTWDKGILRPNSDVKDDLVCAGSGPTLYEASRDEVARFFGPALVASLDAVRDGLEKAEALNR